MVNINKIKDLAKEQGLKLKYITDKLSVAHTFFADASKGKVKISDERLKTIADTLNTTVAYLRDETDIKEKPLTEQDFTEEEKRLLELYNKASEEDKKVIMRMLESFVKENKDKELRRNRL